MIMNMAQHIIVVSGQRYAWRTITRWKEVEASERAIVVGLWSCRYELSIGDDLSRCSSLPDVTGQRQRCKVSWFVSVIVPLVESLGD